MNVFVTPPTCSACGQQCAPGDLNVQGHCATCAAEHNDQSHPAWTRAEAAAESSAVPNETPAADPAWDRALELWGSVQSGQLREFVIDGWTCYLTYADLLPPQTPEEFRSLYESIQAKGMLQSCLLSQTGQDRHYHVLDGMHRLIIAVALELRWNDIKKAYRNLLDETARYEHALDTNLARRHLTPDQRRELALKLRQKGWSFAQIAKATGTSKSTAARDVADGDQPETITGTDGKPYAARQPEPTTDQLAEDTANLRSLMTGGQAHTWMVLQMNSGLMPSRLKRALNHLIASGEVIKTDPGHYALAAEYKPEIEDPEPINDPVTTPEPTPAPAQTENQRIQGLIMAALRAAEDPFGLTVAAIAEQTELTEDMVERHAFAMSFSEKIGHHRRGKEEWHYYIKPDEEPPAPKDTPHNPPPSVDTVRELIIDALRKSARGLGWGELRKYAGLGTSRPEMDAFTDAAEAMLEAGTLAQYDEPHVGRRYHFPETVQALKSKSAVARPVPAPAAPDEKLGLNLVLTDRAVLDRSLLDLSDAIKKATRIKGVASWSVLDTDSLEATRTTITTAIDQMTALAAQLVTIEYALAVHIANKKSEVTA